jgi:hypothetical protein
LIIIQIVCCFQNEKFFIDAPHMLKKSKVYRVPTRTQELILNCSAVSNPVSQINWMFLPRTYSNISAAGENDWKILNRAASFISMNTKDQLTISKYHINEHFIREKNQINSILIIKVLGFYFLKQN